MQIKGHIYVVPTPSKIALYHSKCAFSEVFNDTWAEKTEMKLNVRL
jgi:hypothetical protein